MKQMAIADLDGNYAVVYQTDSPPIPNFIWYDHAVATIKIENGVLTGHDAGRTHWNATLVMAPDGKSVDFLAIVDPQPAPPGTFVMDRNGRPTRIPQNYTGTLTVLLVGSNLTMYGMTCSAQKLQCAF